MPPNFPFTEVKALSSWSNYHGTISGQKIGTYCTPDVLGGAGDSVPRRLERHGSALKAILEHCFEREASLRAVGAGWSLSSIIQPGDVVLDLANMNIMLRVKPDWLASDYRQGRLAQGFTPVFVQGGAHISSINRRLAQTGLALRTSGASDGHRIAGCIATGTHGSHIDVGAVHDTVLALHLVVAPNKALFIQPASGAACSDDVAGWLAKETGIPTISVRDDEQFRAAQVSLGSLGVVHGVVFEAVPLYRLVQLQLPLAHSDPRVWQAIRSLDTQSLHPQFPGRPYYFQTVMHPYPTSGRPGAFVTMYWVTLAGDAPPTSPGPVAPELASDVMGLIGKLGDIVGGQLATPLLRLALSDQLEKRYPRDNAASGLPGEVFGPTSLPPGAGASTEIVVDQRHAETALQTILETLGAEATRGQHLLGAIGVRFVPKTEALLGMNIHDMNCYMELASIRNSEIPGLYDKCWSALERRQIPFTCHWGQQLKLGPERLRTYFGDRPERWRAARQQILDSATARKVFASALLAEVGLI